MWLRVYMSITLDQLRELAPWHFDMPVGEGLRTADGNDLLNERPNAVDPKKIGKVLTHIYPDGLVGKRFLDVACNGGGYSLLARDLGAEHVLGFDVREHWIRQANFLRDHLPGNREVIRFEQCDLLKADGLLGDERFDICLFKGIFYHLPDPVHALSLVTKRVDEVLVFDTDTAIGENDGCLKMYIEGVENPMSGVHQLAWLPTGPKVMEGILHWLGFPYVQLLFWKQPPGRRHGRMRMIAARKMGVLPKSLKSPD